MNTQQRSAVRSVGEAPVYNGLYERLANIASKDAGANVALSDTRSTLSYAELARSSEAFAAQLSEAGVAPLDNVGVLLGNTREFLIAAFGIWKHGAVLVPLNPQLREPELLKCAVDCRLRAMVTASRNDSLMQSIGHQGAGVEHLWLCPLDSDQWVYRGVSGRVPGGMKCLPEAPSTPDWPAIRQYSTGSTGYPKRVTRSHANLIAEFTAVSNFLKVTSQDRVLGVAPFFHSHGLMNSAMLTLLAGGTLHIMGSFLARDVARLVERERLTGFPGVPFMFDLLADLQDRHDFSSLRFIVSAGAPLAEKTAGAFEKKYARRIRSLYGTTETGVIAIQPEAGGQDTRSVGKPIPGVSVRIVNDTSCPVPAGTSGQVEITSPYAASVYDNTSGNEESSFMGSVFLPGDVGQLAADGELTLCGRHRGFINVGGNKVDPGEIEAVLRGLTGVTEAVVFGVPDEASGEKVKAVLAAPAGISRMAVRAHCVRNLAEFKHPKIIEIRTELPKSPLGKILRKYLLEEASGGGPGFVFDPRTGFHAAGSSGVDGDSLDLSTLPPFLRALLVTDGTVTKNIEAYFWEPVEVEVLAHEYATSERYYTDVEVAPGDPILRRCVILRGKLTRSAYAFAESILASNLVSSEMRRKLIEDKKGIGELLRQGKKETYRELSTVRRAEAGEWAIHLGVEKESDVLIRDYSIRLDGRAAMQIEEIFPTARFQVTA